jgi:hypothetical protein
VAETLLVTAVGSGVGHSLLQSLAGRRERLRIVGLNSEPEAPELFQCDVAWRVRPSADPGFVAQLAEIIEAERPGLVIPGRDEDLPLLARLGEERPALAPCLLVGCPALAGVMTDKHHAATFAAAQGLPFAPTVATGGPDAPAQAEALLRRHGFPLIAKPARGNGSRGVRVLLDPAQLQRALARPGLVLQPMIDAPPSTALQPDLAEGVPLFWGVPEPRLYALRGWIGRDGVVHGGLTYAMTMVAGRFERMWRVEEPALADLGERYGRAFSTSGWRGPFHLQLKRDLDGVFWPIEFSGRLGGGSAGRVALGHDEPGELIRHWLGEAALPAAAARSTAGPGAEAACVRARPHDFAVPAQALQCLRTEGRWAR